MALNWNIEKVENYKELTEGDAWQITNALIWMTMVLGIREITPKTAQEFIARAKFLERLQGSWLNKGGKEIKFKDEWVTRRIGLTTNAGTHTRNQFNKNQLDRFYKEA